jgi:altronate dehydratase
MQGDMDVDGGGILAGVPIQEVGRRVRENVVAAASGSPAKSELLCLGEQEFMPCLVGPVL